MDAPPGPDPDEFRAALETAHELGPEYERHVIDGFLERVGTSIDARVDARVRELTRHRRSGETQRSGQVSLAIWSMVLGIPLTAVAASNSGTAAVIVVWVAIAVINLANAIRR